MNEKCIITTLVTSYWMRKVYLSSTFFWQTAFSLEVLWLNYASKLLVIHLMLQIKVSKIHISFVRLTGYAISNNFFKWFWKSFVSIACGNLCVCNPLNHNMSLIIAYFIQFNLLINTQTEKLKHFICNVVFIWSAMTCYKQIDQMMILVWALFDLQH